MAHARFVYAIEQIRRFMSEESGERNSLLLTLVHVDSIKRNIGIENPMFDLRTQVAIHPHARCQRRLSESAGQEPSTRAASRKCRFPRFRESTLLNCGRMCNVTCLTPAFSQELGRGHRMYGKVRLRALCRAPLQRVLRFYEKKIRHLPSLSETLK